MFSLVTNNIFLSYINFSLVEHENIVKFYGVINSPPRIIMEFVEGENLFEFLHPIVLGDFTSIPHQDFPLINR
jgi:serine/threonine protein kinase